METVTEYHELDSDMEIKNVLQEISETSWILGGKILLSRTSTPTPGKPSWSSGHGDFYTISEAPSPMPPVRSPSYTDESLKLLCYAHEWKATWRVSEAYLLVQKPVSPLSAREHTTLEYIQSKGDLGFVTPRVHYHDEFDGRYYLILNDMPGKCMQKVWYTLGPDEKTYYIEQVVKMVKQLSEWQSDTMEGARGGPVLEWFLNDPITGDSNIKPENLLRTAAAMNMDCLSFHFSHNDLKPCRITVNGIGKPIGVWNWSTAGFVPKDWIRTKFLRFRSMNLPSRSDEYNTEVAEWRERIQERLGEEGFPEATAGFTKFFNALGKREM
ncbi:hypothetical protein EDB80DRAFT_564489 [Ilyonectria destructans]|nr:hypothetical protein EDB80DRAFT_564489 [Ilyonectria destructans]